MISTRDNGFTLVELAIALVVIGLLLGGILKGQELIENARISAAMKMIEEYKAGALAFRAKYGEYPGDIRNPAERLPNCMELTCSFGGSRDDRIIAGEEENKIYESANFAVHLTKAGFVNGPIGGTEAMMVSTDPKDRAAFFPLLPLQIAGNKKPPFLIIDYWPRLGHSATAVMVPNVVAALAGHYYDFDTTGRHAFMLDRKMDDGKLFTGDIRQGPDTSCYRVGGVAASANTDYEQGYETCNIRVFAGF